LCEEKKEKRKNFMSCACTEKRLGQLGKMHSKNKICLHFELRKK